MDEPEVDTDPPALELVRAVTPFGGPHHFEVDITDVVETKIASLVAHDSQFDVDDEFLDQMRTFWSNDEGRYVEEFRRITLFR